MQKPNGERATQFINNGVQAFDLNLLPRCNAIAASTGKPCKRAALKGQKYCGIHAGKYRPGGEKGNQKALRSGLFTKKARQERAEASKSIGIISRLIKTINHELDQLQPDQ